MEGTCGPGCTTYPVASHALQERFFLLAMILGPRELEVIEVQLRDDVLRYGSRQWSLRGERWRLGLLERHHKVGISLD